MKAEVIQHTISNQEKLSPQEQTTEAVNQSKKIDSAIKKVQKLRNDFDSVDLFDPRTQGQRDELAKQIQKANSEYAQLVSDVLDWSGNVDSTAVIAEAGKQTRSGEAGSLGTLAEVEGLFKKIEAWNKADVSAEKLEKLDFYPDSDVAVVRDLLVENIDVVMTSVRSSEEDGAVLGGILGKEGLNVDFLISQLNTIDDYMSIAEEVDDLQDDLESLNKEFNEVNVFADENADAEQSRLKNEMSVVQKTLEQKRADLSKTVEGFSKSKMEEAARTLNQLLVGTENALKNTDEKERKAHLQESVDALRNVVRLTNLALAQK